MTFDTTLAHPIGPAAIDAPAQELPLGAAAVRLGFPSPAEDYQDDSIDINRWLIGNPPATFWYRAAGNSMLLEGIRDGDLLAVDRSITPQHGDIVIAQWDGNEPVCKRLAVRGDHIELHSANPHHPPIVFEPGAEVQVFVIAGVVRKLQRTRGRHVCTDRR